MSFLFFSSAFENGSYIPVKHTCKGQDVSPPLSWGGLPDKTRSLALVVDDPDAPRGVFTHWMVYNIPPAAKGLVEGVSRQGQLADGSLQGKNSASATGYMGPCPPPGRVHHYHFKLYALDQLLGLKAGASKEQVLNAMTGHILASAETVGLFEVKGWGS